MKIKCIQCENIFETKDENRKFCNNSCAATYNNSKRDLKKQLDRKCEFCHKNFRVKFEKSTVKYCSVECCRRHQKIKREKRRKEKFEKGEIVYRKHIYKLLVERDGNKCSVCGLTQWMGKPIRLWVDHIDGDPSNNKPENFRLICPNCESQTETSRGKNYGNGRASKGLKPYG